MVIEIAHFRLSPGKSEAFFDALDKAAVLLRAAQGYRGHTAGHGVETPHIATLIVAWRSHADHVEHFEPSAAHDQFLGMLEGFHEGDIDVFHVEAEFPRNILQLPGFRVHDRDRDSP